MSSDLIPPSFNLPQNQSNVITAPTIASASIIKPSAAICFITGTAQLSTIEPPFAGNHELVLIFTDTTPGAFLTTGNIKTAITPVQNTSTILYYEVRSGKYYPTSPSSGGAGNPASPNTSVQFNNGGSFGGDADLVWDKTNNNLKITSTVGHNGLWLVSSGLPTKIWDDGGSLNIDVNGSELLYADLSYSELVTDEFHLVSGNAAFFAKTATLSGPLTVTKTNPTGDDLVLAIATQTATRGFRYAGRFQNIIQTTITSTSAALAAIGDIDTGASYGSSVANIGISSTMRLLNGSAESSFANYSSFSKTGGTTTVAYGYYCGTLFGIGTLTGYAFWYDGGGGDATKGGVFRVNDYGILAYYNPAFTAYTPGATNFERELIRWGDSGTFGTTNNAYIGIEVGGTGTNRPLNLLGASVNAMTVPGTYAAFQALTVQPTSGYKAVDGSAGISTTITTSSLVGKTITVKDGLITGFA